MEDQTSIEQNTVIIIHVTMTCNWSFMKARNTRRGKYCQDKLFPHSSGSDVCQSATWFKSSSVQLFFLNARKDLWYCLAWLIPYPDMFGTSPVPAVHPLTQNQNKLK